MAHLESNAHDGTHGGIHALSVASAGDDSDGLAPARLPLSPLVIVLLAALAVGQLLELHLLSLLEQGEELLHLPVLVRR
jgi:hypothetical protein